MLPRVQLWAALALVGLNARTVMGDGSCVPTWVNTVQNNNFKELGCHDAHQAGCLCRSQAFVDLVAEKARGDCNPTADEVRQGLLGTTPPRFCVGIPAGEVPNAKAAAPSSPSPASTSTPAATTPASTSSTPSPSPTSTSIPSSTSSTLATSTTLSTSTTSGTSTSGAATSTSSHSSTSTTPAAGESTSPAASPVPASGISSGAAAGIGIGVAIVVVAVAVIAFCLLKKRKGQAAPRHSMEISKPLPGSGRTYPTREDRDGDRDGDRDSYDKYGNDIEMTSNRYEDMVPSQQPRTMV